MVKSYARFIILSLFITFMLRANGANPYLLKDSVDVLSADATWKYHNGDNASWASPSFNDKAWDTINMSRFFTSYGYGKAAGPVWWFRLHVKVPASRFNKQLLLVVNQQGASDVYVNGNLVKSFGKVGDVNTEKPYNPAHQLNFVTLSSDTIQTIAVRFSASKIVKQGFNTPSFHLELDNVSEANNVLEDGKSVYSYSLIMFAVFLTVAIFHLLLFLYYRKVLSNLYYSILALLLSFFWLYPYIAYTTHDPMVQGYVNGVNLFIYGPCFFLIVLLLHSIFKQKYNWSFWIVLGLTVLTDIAPFLGIQVYFFTIITQILTSSIKGVIMVIRAVRRKQPGAWIIAVGFLIFLLLILAVFVFVVVVVTVTSKHNVNLSDYIGQIVLFIWALSIPTSMSVYLASDFARTNKFLKLQLSHVKQLSEQNIEKEREKQQLIEGQKRELEIKVKEATAEVSRQKDELAEKNKEITDSINYARRIQTSILPEDELLKEALEDYMVLYKPKDVVSGDFYWCHSAGDKAIFAVADCTGHGVPGAFMSMIGTSLLNEIVIGRGMTDANVILDELRTQLVITLQQSAQHITTRDGMDIALCVLDKKHRTLQYSGANNSLYLISKNIAVNGSVKESTRVKLSNEHLLEILPDKQPIGYQEDKMNDPFTRNVIQLHKGDTIFITSDGYIDQFGGERNKKFTSKRFRELITSLVGLPLDEQSIILERTMEDWKKRESQTDDICVMGVRIN